jgi:hypothetical protein
MVAELRHALRVTVKPVVLLGSVAATLRDTRSRIGGADAAAGTVAR